MQKCLCVKVRPAKMFLCKSVDLCNSDTYPSYNTVVSMREDFMGSFNALL